MTSTSYIDYALTTSQAEAVACTTAGGILVIRGPAGSGKTRVLEEIVRKALEEGGRALIVAPLYGLQALERRLGDAGHQSKVGWINARTAAAHATASSQDAPSAAALVLPQLLRSAAVREAALRFGPNIIVVDDVDLIGPSQVAQIMDLGETQSGASLVFTEESGGEVRWTAASRIIELEPLREPDAKRRILHFQRRSDEALLIGQIRNATRDLPGLSGITRSGESVLLSLDSSWAAVERALLRLRRRLERSTHQLALEEAWDLGDEIDPPDAFELRFSEESIEKLLADVDSLGTDSKVEALVASDLWPGRNGVARLCVVTGSGATAEYLSEALAGDALVLYLADPRTVSGRGDLDAFRREGGVCVITDQAVHIFDLGPLDAIVHFDLPPTRRRFRRRSARLTPLIADGERVEAVMEGEPSTWRHKSRAMLRDAGFISGSRSGEE